MKVPKFDEGDRPLDMTAWVVESADAPWSFRSPQVKVRSIHQSMLNANQRRNEMQREALQLLSQYHNPTDETITRHMVYRAGITVRQVRIIEDV